MNETDSIETDVEVHSDHPSNNDGVRLPGPDATLQELVVCWPMTFAGKGVQSGTIFDSNFETDGGVAGKPPAGGPSQSGKTDERGGSTPEASRLALSKGNQSDLPSSQK